VVPTLPYTAMQTLDMRHRYKDAKFSQGECMAWRRAQLKNFLSEVAQKFAQLSAQLSGVLSA